MLDDIYSAITFKVDDREMTFKELIDSWRALKAENKKLVELNNELQFDIRDLRNKNDKVILDWVENWTTELRELKELVLALFVQSCCCDMNNYKFDHQFISAYENAQRKLIEWGKIKEEDCLCDL